VEQVALNRHVSNFQFPSLSNGSVNYNRLGSACQQRFIIDRTSADVAAADITKNRGANSYDSRGT